MKRVGFTIIELLVVIGVITILLGLALPPLARTRERARHVASLSQIRQNVAAIDAYSADNNGYYPAGRPTALGASYQWHDPLIEAGYFKDRSQADPVGIKEIDSVRYVMSVCMLYPPGLMTPRDIVPLPDFAPTTAMTTHSVTSPALKGLMYQGFLGNGDTLEGFPPQEWCCAEPRMGPVVFADGSGELAVWTKFRDDEMPGSVRWMGIPIFSTWYGVQGVDRRQ